MVGLWPIERGPCVTLQSNRVGVDVEVLRTKRSVLGTVQLYFAQNSISHR